jgi:aminoglycoside 6'-N-acetyltransferase I
MKIRKATKKDYKKMAEIYMRGFTRKEYHESWTPKLSYRKIMILKRYCDLYVLERGGKIIGFNAVNPNKWFLGGTVEGEEFAIDPDYQNKGYGKFFLKEVEKIYRDKGYKYFIFISYKKTTAFKKYKKLNYKESKDNIIFEKEL